MPALGLGVYQIPPDLTAATVKEALRVGYRLVDTASFYNNEREVGEGIRRSGLARTDVFVETKIWVSDYGYERTLRAFDKSATKLGLDQIDLLLLHKPEPADFTRTIAAYHALEALLVEGRVRAIGVSNFMPMHLTELRRHTSVVPAVNQIEVHPYFTQLDVQQSNSEFFVITQAWSPIGGITRYRGIGRSAFNDPAIARIAARHRKTPAQIMIRWHLDEGRAAIPKSVRPERIVANFDVFDFALNEEERRELNKLDTGIRGGPDPNAPTDNNL